MTYANELIDKDLPKTGPGGSVEGEDTTKTCGLEVRRVEQTLGYQARFDFLHPPNEQRVRGALLMMTTEITNRDQMFPLEVDQQAGDIRAKDLCDDVPATTHHRAQSF